MSQKNKVRLIVLAILVVVWLVTSGAVASWFVSAQAAQNQAVDSIASGVGNAPTTGFSQAAQTMVPFVWLVARGACLVPFLIGYVLFLIFTGMGSNAQQPEKAKHVG